MMTPVEGKLLRWLRKVGADRGQLDVLVEDQKCQQANRINNRGLVVQIRYLLRTQTPKELRKTVWHELAVLRRYGMKQQSKTNSKKNRRAK